MKKVISLGLLAIMLAVTTGVPVYKHTCHIFDRSELSFVSQDPCCSPQDGRAGARLDIACCSLEHFDTTLDYETLVEKSQDFPVAFSLVLNHVGYRVVSFTERVNRYQVQRPPPLANRTLLNQIQVYRI